MKMKKTAWSICLIIFLSLCILPFLGNDISKPSTAKTFHAKTQEKNVLENEVRYGTGLSVADKINDNNNNDLMCAMSEVISKIHDYTVLQAENKQTEVKKEEEARAAAALAEQRKKTMEGAIAAFKNGDSGGFKSLSYDDVFILARIAQLEAGGSVQGMGSVCQVVLNRIESSKFPNNVRDVVFARNQFVPASHIYDKNPSDNALEAVYRVLNGECFVSGKPLFFCSSSTAHKNRVYIETVSGNKFYY